MQQPTLEALTYWSVDSLRHLLIQDTSKEWLVHHLRAHAHRVDRLTLGCTTRFDFRMTRSRDQRTPLNKCIHWQERHLTSSKCRLRKQPRSSWGVETAHDMWRNCDYDGCVQHLAQCVPRFRWAGRELLHAACTIADAYGILDDIEQRFKAIVDAIAEPNFAHPSMNSTHLHVSQDGRAGTGGSFHLFASHLGRICDWKTRGMPLPSASWDDKGGFFCFARCNLYQRCDDISPEFLLNMALGGYALGQLLPNEIEKLLHAHGGWRKFSCAMAMHQRVGEAAKIRELGPDVLKMILEMV